MDRRLSSSVETRQGGLRLVAWLALRFPYADEAAWSAFAREGRLMINGRASGPEQILESGDMVEFHPPLDIEPELDRSYRVIGEEGGFLIVEKPSGLPCHPSGRFFRSSLWHVLRERWENIHIITRLDRESSGLVLIATEREAARRANALHMAGAIEKNYVAMVHGDFPPEYDAAGWLINDASSSVRKKRQFLKVLPDTLAEGAGPQTCRTLFRLRERKDGFSLVEARLMSGRTHQIRATLLGMGYPMVGDKLYGKDEGCFIRFAEGKLSEEDIRILILPGQALHCASLSFPDISGRPLTFHSTPPWDFPPRGHLEAHAQV